MADFMEHRKNMLLTRFVGVDQKSAFARKKLSMRLVVKIADEGDLQPKVPGHFAQNVFLPKFHLPLFEFLFLHKAFNHFVDG